MAVPPGIRSTQSDAPHGALLMNLCLQSRCGFEGQSLGRESENRQEEAPHKVSATLLLKGAIVKGDPAAWIHATFPLSAERRIAGVAPPWHSLMRYSASRNVNCCLLFCWFIIAGLMETFLSVQGPVKKIDGKLVLCIPLSAGGDQLIECSKGISEVEASRQTITRA